MEASEVSQRSSRESKSAFKRYLRNTTVALKVALCDDVDALCDAADALCDGVGAM